MLRRRSAKFSLGLKANQSKLARNLIILVGLLLISYGVWNLWQRYGATHNPDPSLPAQVVTYSTDKPDETPVPPNLCRSQPSNQPTSIEIPSLNKTGCVQTVGIDQDNRIAVPTNVHVAGWFQNSVLPGEAGVSIIDGHVRGRYTDGIFQHIAELDKGAKIIVKSSDGTPREFEIVNVANYSVEDTATEQYKQIDGVEAQLTLVTCGGSYNAGTRSYNERTLARAKLINQR